ncbi:UvrD-helicase domain-containing protein [Actinomarinicola tropica]|nr:ATP-dependent helicase [Actinomarinicola tropica]
MPNAGKPDWYVSHPIAETLLTAPPGCGKTEGIARWLRVLVERGELLPPRRALGLTFSNKAKANLRSRLRRELGPRWWRWATVTNFHGWAFHLHQHHCTSIGLDPLEIAPQRGWQATTTRAICREYECEEEELQRVLRSCKLGAYDDDTVIERLDDYGMGAALAYEQRIREAGRRDFNDLIRLGLLVLGEPRVVSLYRERFAVVVVDEVQDLSLAQFDLASPIAPGRTLWAGDAAQGIYGFAGAQPDLVVERIRGRDACEIELTASYRSSPPVLRAVSALSKALGGQDVRAASEDEWEGRGRLVSLRTKDARQEADWVAATVEDWMDEDPALSVGVIARAKGRRKWVDEEIQRRGLLAEIWDFPAHRPSIVELLVRHLPLVDPALDRGEAVEDLYLRCYVDIDDLDLDSQDELNEVFDTIGELVVEMSLADIVSGIRISSSPEDPVGPGLHLLNGHVGKGQQFDRVIIVGLEEAFLPHYRAMKSGRAEDLDAELAVLHVMASRAREQLVVATCELVPNWQGENRRRDPSRWFGLIEAEVDQVIDAR